MLFMTPNALEFLRALVQTELWNSAAAEESYARGMTGWRRHTAGSVEAWERSDVMRWRRAAEAALAE
ncbi:MAG TPA: hypothetical protein VMT18_14625 [Planctomycetota bacterium]|nr:hypothetical protein [Planctomycetota bacterium]